MDGEDGMVGGWVKGHKHDIVKLDNLRMMSSFILACLQHTSQILLIEIPVVEPIATRTRNTNRGSQHRLKNSNRARGRPSCPLPNTQWISPKIWNLGTTRLDA